MRTRRLAGITLALVGAALGGLAMVQPAQAAQPTEPNPAVQASEAKPTVSGWDFTTDGVRIFSAADPNSPVNGLGYYQQGADLHRWVYGPEYRCDYGSSALWGEVTNLATGVTGWVPECNLSPPPAPTPPQG